MVSFTFDNYTRGVPATMSLILFLYSQFKLGTNVMVNIQILFHAREMPSYGVGLKETMT